jgi:hypothetical protein
MREDWDLKRKRYFWRGFFLVVVSVVTLAGIVSHTVLSFQIVKTLVEQPAKPAPPIPPGSLPVQGTIPAPLLPGHEVLSYILGMFPSLDFHAFSTGDQVGLGAAFLLLLGILFLERSKNYRYRILTARRTEEEKNRE